MDTATAIFLKISQPWIQRRKFLKKIHSRGYSDGNFLKKFTAVDTATAKRGYSDSSALIQRRKSVDTAMARRGYIDDVPWNFSKSDRRRYSILVAIATA